MFVNLDRWFDFERIDFTLFCLDHSHPCISSDVPFTCWYRRCEKTGYWWTHASLEIGLRHYQSFRTFDKWILDWLAKILWICQLLFEIEFWKKKEFHSKSCSFHHSNHHYHGPDHSLSWAISFYPLLSFGVCLFSFLIWDSLQIALAFQNFQKFSS